MQKNISSLITKLLLVLVIFAANNALAQSTIYALTTTNDLISFSSATPGTTTSPIAITGLAVGQELVGFDSRPRTGELYALGYNATTSMGRLYKLSLAGVLTALGATDLSLNLGSVTDNVGMDFNPTVDRIRVVSTNGKNYRLHPDLGTIVATDTDLSYAAGDANFGTMPVVGQIAYSNSYVAATKTTLYYLDESLDAFGRATGASPNLGQIQTLGATGVAFNPADRSIDMDVAFTGTSNVIYLLANTVLNDDLYSINATTGAATMLGSIGSGVSLKDIAVAIDRTLPALTGTLTYGLTTHVAPSAQRMVTFDAANPGVIRTDFAISGLKAGQTLVGMDMRPQNRQMYALGVNAAMPTDTFTTIYTLNLASGAATIFADSVKLNLAGSGNIAFDFNPSANRLRVMSGNNDRSYRVNLNLSPVTVIRDTMHTYKTGDVNFGIDPMVVAAAYTNSYGCATSTQLFDVEAVQSVLALQATPNGGFLNTRGSFGLTFDPADYSLGFDIVTNNQGGSPINTAYLSANVMGGNNFDSLYITNLLSGATTRVGRIGNGVGIRDIAAEISPLPTATITGNNSPTCSGNSAMFTLTGTVGAVVTYNINGAANMTVTLTGGMATITVTNSTSNKMLNLVSITDGYCGQNLTGNSTVMINANGATTPTITPSGPTTFCSDSPTTLMATAGMANYVWKRSTTVVQSGMSASYTPTASGNHSVTVTDMAGCMKTSTFTSVVRNLSPLTNAGADKMVCDGASVQIGGNSATTYSYSWEPTMGLSNPMIGKPMATPMGNMTYILYATSNANGCMRADTVNLTSLSIPPTPTVTSTPSGNTFVLAATTPNAVSINWYRNGAGLYANRPANSSISVYSSNGMNAYTVRSKGSNGCLSMASTAVNVKLGADKDGNALITFNSEMLKAYPNPTSGLLNVEVYDASQTEGKLVLYNSLGQVAFAKNVTFSDGKVNEILDISALAQGIYSLSFEAEGVQQITKIVRE